MNRTVVFPRVLLSLFLLGWTSLSRNISDPMRSLVVEIFTPAWGYASEVKNYLSDRPILQRKTNDSRESSLLELENHKLKAQIELAKEWIFFETNIHHESKSSLESHLLDYKLKAVPAQVIYRQPSSWSSSLWVDVGEETNQEIGHPIIEKNSPVVTGNSLIGIVDYVGKRQSRVRLITDSGVAPSVRVARTESPTELIEWIDALIEKLREREDLFSFIPHLQALKEKAATSTGEVYLAKGELRGNGAPFWRSRQPTLKGVGFNYDYADAEGPARDLRSGRLFAGMEKPIPLILEGDHLVTSGLDGVFPKGLSVAITKRVFPLKEGAFAYEIEALPTARCLNDLKVIFILPALSCE